MGCKNTKHITDNECVCYICFKNRPEYMHYPCCHYGICEECKNDLEISENKYKRRCPVCKKKSVIKKIYFQGNFSNEIVSTVRTINREKNLELISINNKLLSELDNLRKKNESLSQAIKYEKDTNKNVSLINEVSIEEELTGNYILKMSEIYKTK